MVSLNLYFSFSNRLRFSTARTAVPTGMYRMANLTILLCIAFSYRIILKSSGSFHTWFGVLLWRAECGVSL